MRRFVHPILFTILYLAAQSAHPRNNGAAQNCYGSLALVNIPFNAPQFKTERQGLYQSTNTLYRSLRMEGWSEEAFKSMDSIGNEIMAINLRKKVFPVAHMNGINEIAFAEFAQNLRADLSSKEFQTISELYNNARLAAANGQTVVLGPASRYQAINIDQEKGNTDQYFWLWMDPQYQPKAGDVDSVKKQWEFVYNMVHTKGIQDYHDQVFVNLPKSITKQEVIQHFSDPKIAAQASQRDIPVANISYPGQNPISVENPNVFLFEMKFLTDNGYRWSTQSDWGSPQTNSDTRPPDNKLFRRWSLKDMQDRLQYYQKQGFLKKDESPEWLELAKELPEIGDRKKYSWNASEAAKIRDSFLIWKAKQNAPNIPEPQISWNTLAIRPPPPPPFSNLN